MVYTVNLKDNELFKSNRYRIKKCVLIVVKFVYIKYKTE